MKKNNKYIFPVIMGIICCGFFINPMHMREFLSVLLVGGYLMVSVFRNYIKIPTSLPFYSVMAYGVVITLSYFSTIGSSMNYRHLLTQYIGILVFVTVYTNKIKYLKRSIMISGLIMSIAYMLMHWLTGYHYFDILFMHRNVAGMFFALCAALVLQNGLGYKNGIVLLTPIIIALLFTGSRGAMGALFVAVLINLIINKKWLLGTLLILGTAILCLPITPFGERLWSVTIFNGRDTIFAMAIERLLQTPLFGGGIGNLHFNSANNGGSHSLYFSIYSGGGIFALIPFMIPVFYLFKNKYSIPICVYLIYAIVSDCGANVPNNVIYWALLAYGLQKNMTELEYKDIYGIKLKNQYFNASIRAFSVLVYLYYTLWSVKHLKTNLTLVASLQYGKEIAIPLLSNAIEVEPRCFKAYYFRAVRYLEEGKYKEARADFIITEHLCPNFGITREILEKLK